MSGPLEAGWVGKLREELLAPVYGRISGLELEVVHLRARLDSRDKGAQQFAAGQGDCNAAMQERLDSLERDTAMLGQDIAALEKNVAALMQEASQP